jgi:hypothetical protein
LDEAQAVQWYLKAANHGHVAAQTNLGARFASGSGVAADLTQAVQWFRRAAEKGDPSAQFNLGVLYANGQGVAQDPAEAYVWLALAASRAAGAEQQRYAAARDTIAALLTPEQFERARTRVQERMKPQ